ncbi:MAG: glycosyltransferase family 2 protein [Deltaproteobacteria bacterium]|nr:glycosyltransferase family 2 protein [Deltaproteobacteria bacterium]
MSALPLSLVVFAMNEAMNVPTVLPEMLRWLRARGAPYELLFVDDGSTDDTRAKALEVLDGDPHGRVLTHDRNRGIGAALKTGVRAATLPWVTFLPCDGQIPVTELEHLLAAAERDERPVVFSVYRDRDDGLHRKVLSFGVRALIFAVHLVKLRSDGPYLFRRELFDPSLLVPDTFFLNFEFPIRTLRAGIPASTVTIECVPRRAGVSKSTGLKRIVGVARDLVGLRLRLWQGR